MCGKCVLKYKNGFLILRGRDSLPENEQKHIQAVIRERMAKGRLKYIFIYLSGS